MLNEYLIFVFSSRRRHTRSKRDWSSDVCSSDLDAPSPYVDHLEADLAGLPPVFIAVAGLDPLRDDSEALHVRLEEAGTPVDYHPYPAVLHSFLHFGRMLDDAGDVVTRTAGFAAAH